MQRPGTIETIHRLRAVRLYGPGQPSAEQLRTVLEAARATGSRQNAQEWELVVVHDPDRRARLAACGKYAQVLAEAPTVVALAAPTDVDSFDLGRLSQNVMLAASSVDLASCPAELQHPEEVNSLLALPDSLRCRYAIALGPWDRERYERQRRATVSWLPRGRRPLRDLVHGERYGSPCPELPRTGGPR